MSVGCGALCLRSHGTCWVSRCRAISAWGLKARARTAGRARAPRPGPAMVAEKNNTTHTHLCTGSTSAPGPSRPPRWPRPPTLTRMRRLPWLAGRGRPLVRCVVAARARMKREVCVQHGAVVEATLFWPALSFFIHLAARPVERHALSTAGPAPSAAVLLEARPSSPATSVSQ